MEYKLPKRIEDSNKSTYGRVLNIAGSDYMPGAAYLSSVSALKIGCGYCFLCSTERAINAVAAQTSNVVFVPQNKISDYINNADVIEIGCGLGTDMHAVKMFSKVLDNTYATTPLVVDADALNILAQNDFDQIYDFTNKKFEKLVFTPHPKEASRLLGVTLEEVLDNVEKSAKKMFPKALPGVNLLRSCFGNSHIVRAGSNEVRWFAQPKHLNLRCSILSHSLCPFMEYSTPLRMIIICPSLRIF